MSDAPQVTVVDYGVGNLRSVKRALEFAGSSVTITDSPEHILQADRLVLPGVGAFGHCMKELQSRGLTDAVLKYARLARPFLGICVGMQIMLTMGDEFGIHTGLNLIDGNVRRIPDAGADGKPHVLPYIGWAALSKPTPKTKWEGTVFADTKEGEHVYLLHSYAATLENPSHALAQYHYNGVPICAAIAKDHLVGLQFHPEKSAHVGIRIIKQFLSV